MCKGEHKLRLHNITVNTSQTDPGYAVCNLNSFFWMNWICINFSCRDNSSFSPLCQSLLLLWPSTSINDTTCICKFDATCICCKLGHQMAPHCLGLPHWHYQNSIWANKIISKFRYFLFKMCFKGDFGARRDGEKVFGAANPWRFWKVSYWQVGDFLKVSGNKSSHLRTA